MNLNLPKTIPMLPGHLFQDHLGDTHHKVQQFNLINGTMREKTNYITEEYDPNLLDSLRMKTPPDLTYGNRKKPENDYIPRIQPPWLKYDRQVLRFYCFFQESVVESPLENYRLRKCTIYYYLSDGTIHVNEPRSENSGIPQGVFIKRQKIPKKLNNTDEFYTWQDFNLGLNINLFERVFRITDCDIFTKEFFEYMGVKLNDPEQQQNDSFQFYKEHKDVKIPPPDIKEYKEYNEVKLHGGHPNSGLEKYLSNDRKVLSFSILWEDFSLEGGANYFTLNFFLADDTMEVKECRKQNSGKDPFPLLLNRKKIPKMPILTHYPGMTLKKEEFYGPKDLICGQYIVIYNKDCLIFDCDDFTRQWYKENLTLDQQPAQLKAERGKKFYQPVPPFNGYGSEEDSLGSVFALQPKPPKKDVNKMYTQDQYILRFESRMLSLNKEDNIRKFIISFFCGDDTVQVYEIADKNSGIWQGKFLERSRHKNPLTQKFYVERDFQLGEVIQLNVYKFQLLSADEYTHKYMKSKPEVFKESDIEQVIEKVKKLSSNYKTYDEFLVDLIKKVDKRKNGFVNFEELSTGLADLGYKLTHQEVYTLIRYFDSNNSWQLNLKEFYQGLGGAKTD